MNNILQLILIVVIGSELLFSVLSTVCVFGGKNNAARRVLGAFGCLFSLLYLILLVAGVLNKAGFDFDFPDKRFYSVYDNMLIWAVICFGVVTSLYAVIAGFKRVSEKKKETASAVRNVGTGVKNNDPEAVRTDLFKGLDNEYDINDFLGTFESGDGEEIKNKRETLEKIEKLLK